MSLRPLHSQALLEISQLGFGYQLSDSATPLHWVVRNLSLKAQAGEIIGILGPNGQGKSTLLNLLSQELLPLEGKIQWNLGAPPFISYLTQNSNKLDFLPFTVEELLSLVQEVTPLSTQNKKIMALPLFQSVDEALEFFELKALRRRPLKELSGGQRQRVELAKTFLWPAKAILLDEPSTGLDVGGLDLLASLFCKIRSRGESLVLVVDHNLIEILGQTDQILCFDKSAPGQCQWHLTQTAKLFTDDVSSSQNSDQSCELEHGLEHKHLSFGQRHEVKDKK